MLVIPAVDLRGGKCVRLREGRPEAETVFSDEPVAVARRWAELGAPRLHVVDLDGAFAGAPRQSRLIDEIARKGTRELFLNPGAESEGVIARAEALGLHPILACSILDVGRSPEEFQS